MMPAAVGLMSGLKAARSVLAGGKTQMAAVPGSRQSHGSGGRYFPLLPRNISWMIRRPASGRLWTQSAGPTTTQIRDWRTPRSRSADLRPGLCQRGRGHGGKPSGRPLRGHAKQLVEETDPRPDDGKSCPRSSSTVIMKAALLKSPWASSELEGLPTTQRATGKGSMSPSLDCPREAVSLANYLWLDLFQSSSIPYKFFGQTRI